MLQPGYPENLSRAQAFSCKFNLSAHEPAEASFGFACMSSVPSSGSPETTIINGLAILDPEYQSLGSEFGRWSVEVYIPPIQDLEDRFKQGKFTKHGKPIFQRSTPITLPKGRLSRSMPRRCSRASSQGIRRRHSVTSDYNRKPQSLVARYSTFLDRSRITPLHLPPQLQSNGRYPTKARTFRSLRQITWYPCSRTL